MSKDKGVKNNKKSAAAKTPGKEKAVSSYKSEGKSSQNTQSSLDVFTSKEETKGAKKPKS